MMGAADAENAMGTVDAMSGANGGGSVVERRLATHYRGERAALEARARRTGAASAAEARVACLAAIAREAEARTGACPVAVSAPFSDHARKASSAPLASALSFPAFVATQARFVRPWVWAAQVAIVVVMVVVCLLGRDEASAAAAACLLGAATLAVGLPDLLASKARGVAEMEYACRFGCRAAVLARLIVLGCSDALVLACLALAAPLIVGTSGAAALLHACVPYFFGCAGCLLIARRAPREAAVPLSLAWTALVMAVAFAVCTASSTAYGAASMGMWALAAAAAGAWTVREAAAWVAAAGAGLDVLYAEREGGLSL